MEHWAIHIDIDGFNDTYEKSDQALRSLRALMEGIYFVGNNWCLNPPEKIFAHQYGEGFSIVGDIVRDTIEVPVILAVALMQKVLLSGGIARAVIDEGSYSDSRGGFPPCIRDLSNGSNCYHLGHGMMTILPSMGTALIRIANLAKVAPAGGLLITHASFRTRITPGIHPMTTDDPDLISIDWIHTKVKPLEQVQRIAGLSGVCPNDLECKLKDYIRSSDLKDDWKKNTLHSLRMASSEPDMTKTYHTPSIALNSSVAQYQ